MLKTDAILFMVPGIHIQSMTDEVPVCFRTQVHRESEHNRKGNGWNSVCHLAVHDQMLYTTLALHERSQTGHKPTLSPDWRIKVHGSSWLATSRVLRLIVRSTVALRDHHRLAWRALDETGQLDGELWGSV